MSHNPLCTLCIPLAAALPLVKPPICNYDEDNCAGLRKIDQLTWTNISSAKDICRISSIEHQSIKQAAAMMAEDPTATLPPPYTSNETANPNPMIQPTQVINFRRSLTDTREQIASNLSIFRFPHAEIITTRMTRAQFSSNSTLVPLLRPELDGPLPPASPDATQQQSDLLRIAMVVTRTSKGAVEVAVRSRACVTLEDAMESLLERVEILTLSLLMRHGQVAAEPVSCCYWCKRMMSRAQMGAFAPETT